MNSDEKIIIYQVLPRLFGNQNKELTPNGDLQQNGCGKLADFTSQALKQIVALGANYIWYTGVIEHATQTDFSKDGIDPDHPAVVKGKAGSPYAIKDYYDIAPALATKVDSRMKEFEALVKRSHKNGLKVLIDFVPNHVARQYKSDKQPQETKQLGADDQSNQSFSNKNNFYYIPDSEFRPHFDLTDPHLGTYKEFPAKSTGNDQFTASPTKNDWYETIKLNYGVDYSNNRSTYFHPISDTWLKMLDIILFWASKGIDGFRCDMVEMVPIPFWNWVIPQVKEKYPQLLFIAEAYDPSQYWTYLNEGKFDYLYDKVGLYDTLKGVIQDHIPASNITYCWQNLHGLEKRMLFFLENHDEQRIASPYFALNPIKALPAMVVSACLNTNPIMIYNGQEFGEKGMDQEGFSGLDGRTTIFDYWSMDTVRRWNNRGKFNLTNMIAEEKSIYNYYRKLLNIAKDEKAITKGVFFDLMYVNPSSNFFNPNKQYVFLRKYEQELLLILVNFDANQASLEINIPQHAFEYLNFKAQYDIEAKDLLSEQSEVVSLATDKRLKTKVAPYGSKILRIELKD